MELKIKPKRNRIELIPMIDIMFFIVVFFMLFATFNTAQTGVEVELPKTLHLGQTRQNILVISINKNNKLFFGKELIPLDRLAEKVQNEIKKDKNAVFVIKPDLSIPYGELIKVMDILAGAGVERPLLGVERDLTLKTPKK